MWKRVAALIAVFLLAANLSAGDPWKDKPYKQWDEKEVRKVLTDSPWAKDVRVSLGSQPLAGGGGAPNAPGPALGGGYGEGPTGGERGAMQPGAGLGERQQEAGVPQVSFLVRWASARSVRQALARGAMMRGTLQEPDAEKFLAQEPQEYTVVVLGPDMTPFNHTDEKTLKEKTFLHLKKSRQKVSPARVEIQRARDSQAVSAVVFYFAKKTGAGEPVIAADEKSVEFVCEVGVYLKTNFEPQKMTGAQGLDW